MEKSYIWTLPTRVFHLLLALLILFMFFSDDDNLLLYHVMGGYLLLVVLLFRFVWGFMGPKYSSFKFFYFGKTHMKLFLKDIFEPKQSYFGHNPLASYLMMGMLILGILCIISGIVAYGSEEHKGLLSSLEIGFAEDLHEMISNLLMLLIIGHFVGIVVDRLLHKEHETLKSIITGHKKTLYNDDVKLTWFQKSVALFFLLAFVALVYFFIVTPQNFLTA